MREKALLDRSPATRVAASAGADYDDAWRTPGSLVRFLYLQSIDYYGLNDLLPCLWQQDQAGVNQRSGLSSVYCGTRQKISPSASTVLSRNLNPELSRKCKPFFAGVAAIRTPNSRCCRTVKTAYEESSAGLGRTALIDWTGFMYGHFSARLGEVSLSENLP
jgi:hypothetical protein